MKSSSNEIELEFYNQKELKSFEILKIFFKKKSKNIFTTHALQIQKIVRDRTTKSLCNNKR